jgi:hypothetical protein
MMNRFTGDPKLYLTASGSDIIFKGGQPVMDSGLENLASISLFTAPGWWANSLTTDENKKIGSDFEETAKGSITLQKLSDIEKAYENTLDNPAFGEVSADVINPENWRLDVSGTIKPPGKDIEQLRLTRNGQNWINQSQQDTGDS